MNGNKIAHTENYCTLDGPGHGFWNAMAIVIPDLPTSTFALTYNRDTDATQTVKQRKSVLAVIDLLSLDSLDELVAL